VKRWGVFAAVVALAACGRAPQHPLRDLDGHQDLSQYRIQSVHGVRDGDRLAAQVLISDSSSILNLDMHFAIGSPTMLASGTWSWSRPGTLLHGNVAAQSVTFLGGQDDGPSIGGVFDLNGDGARLRVDLPLTVLPRSFRPATSNPQHP